MTIPLTLSQVPAATPYAQYIATAGQTAFPYPFPITQDSDLVLVINGVTQSTDVGYSLSGQGNPTGGFVTTTAPQAAGTIVTVFRDIVIQRVTQIAQNSGYSSVTFNAEFNNIYLILQQLSEQLAFTLQIPNSNNPAPITTLQPGNYANTYLGFDANGNPQPVILTSSGPISFQILAPILGLIATPQEVAAGIVPTNYLKDPGDVERYGVIGDGVADDTAALNAIGTAAWTSDMTFFCRPGLTFNTTDTVTFAAPYAALMMDPGSVLSYAGPPDRAALVLGSDGQQFTGRDFNVSTIFAANANDYSSHSCVGVQLRGAWAGNRVRLNSTIGFTCSWQLWASNAAGMAYNIFDLGISGNASYHLELRSAVANGFINENIFLNGDFQIFSSFVPGVNGTSHGVIFRNEPGAYVGHNKNHFIKPCFQLTQSGVVGERIPIIFADNGGYNQFQNCRMEGYNGELVRVTSDTVAVTYNTIDIGYQTTAFGSLTAYMTETDGGYSYGNRITLAGRPLSERFHSGDLMLKAFVPSAGNLGVLGMFMQSSASGTETGTGTGKLGKDYIIPTNALGVYVDTSYYKNFEVRADILAARPGRFVITAYNATGNQLTTTRAVNFPGLSENSNYGGHAYQTGSDTTGTTIFRVDSNVDHIKIMFAPGTNPCAVRSYSVTGYASLSEINGQNNGLAVYGGVFAYSRMLAPAIPTKLGPVYSNRGDIIGSTVAASGAAQGWQCSLSGYNAADWANTTLYRLNQIVNNDTGKIYVCVGDGTSAGSGGPTGTGQGITDGSATWNYVGVGLATWTAQPNNP